jgi:hypothetical protein
MISVQDWKVAPHDPAVRMHGGDLLECSDRNRTEHRSGRTPQEGAGIGGWQ